MGEATWTCKCPGVEPSSTRIAAFENVNCLPRLRGSADQTSQSPCRSDDAFRHGLGRNPASTGGAAVFRDAMLGVGCFPVGYTFGAD